MQVDWYEPHPEQYMHSPFLTVLLLSSSPALTPTNHHTGQAHALTSRTPPTSPPAAQWAALNNRVAETTYLLDMGAAIDAQDSTGQTALMWAAVRGSLPVMETLLRSGANAGLTDNRGYSCCHVAAQYGQTAVLYHLALKWGIDVDVPDNDGRTSLHWAAYKGYADCLRLLLVGWVGWRRAHLSGVRRVERAMACSTYAPFTQAQRANQGACSVLLSC